MAKVYRSIRSIPAPQKPQEKPKAYSYLRFSTPEQEEGDSIRRQISVTQAYAQELGLELDESLRFEDKGVSAFRGKNSAEGALATFREYVEAGKVPRGSYLMVESLDRISRDEILDAMDVLNGILRKGICVAVVNGRKVFSRQSVTANPFELMLAIMSFATAHEESAKKSYRSHENWKTKRARAAQTREAMTGKGPAWLKLNAQTGAWDLIPERVAVVQRIFRDFLSGIGSTRIARALNVENVPTWGNTRKGGEQGEFWHQSYIKKLLFSPLVIGTIEPSTWEVNEETGEKVQRMLPPIPGYYPAVIDAETWKQAQAIRKGSRVPRQDTPESHLGNLFAHLLRCSKCKSTASMVGKGSSTGRAYVVCNRARRKDGCGYQSAPYARLEAAFLRDVERLIATCPAGSGDTQTDTALEQMEAALESIPERLEALTKAYSATGVREILDEIIALDSERERLEGERDALLWKQSESAGPVVAKRLEALREALSAEHVDRRNVNARLRLLFAAVEVDGEQGVARFEWKHGGTSEVIFGMPGAVAETRRASAARARAALFSQGREAVLANLAKARAVRAAKREAAKAAAASPSSAEAA